MSNIICAVPFCDNKRSIKHKYCPKHRWEREKYKIKPYKELLPIWCKKKCKRHGYLINSNISFGINKKTLVCKLCIKIYNIDKEKIRIRNKNRYHQRKDSKLKKRYGINTLTYQQMLDNQNQLCAICKIHINDHQLMKGEGKSFAIDHCHKTNQIRGLLCYRCNMGLGYFQDNHEFTQNATEYLLKFR